MINKWNFQTPTEEELHKRDALAAEIGFSPVICLLLVRRLKKPENSLNPI